MKINNLTRLCSMVFLCFINLIFAQRRTEDFKAKNDQEKPIIGKLDNGFQYIIKPLSQEVEKNEIRLIVNVGTNQEDKDQYNHAHLLEHMAFNYLESYTNFKNDTELLSQLNLRQRDLHAFTFANSTWYQFIHPKNVDLALDTILDYSYEIASGKVVFKEEQIKAERKAVYQEYLSGNPEKSYSRRKILNKLYWCNKKTPRPDQFEKWIMNSSNRALRRFYRDWYLPDLMTIVAVGNFQNIDEVENKIKKMFKDIRMPKNPRLKTDCLNKYLNGPQSYTVANSFDEKKSDTDFQFRFRKNSNHFNGLRNYQELELWNILKPIINNRLKSLRHSYNVDYSVNFETYPYLFNNTIFIKKLGVSKQGIPEVFSTFSGLSKYGITESEYRKAVDFRLENLKQPPLFPVDYWADFYTNRIVNEAQDFEPNVEDKILFLEKLEVSTINSYLKEYSWIPDDISIIIPKDGNTNEYNKQKILKNIRKGLDSPGSFKEIKAPTQILANEEKLKLSQADIISRRKGTYGEDIIELGNGLKLVLKQNKPKGGRYKDKIMIRGFSPIGASCFGKGDYEAMLSPSLIKNGGLSDYNKFEIANFLEDTSFQYELYDYVTSSETGFEGAFDPEDLEAFLQVIYLSFTAPRFDKESWKDWKMEELKKFHRNAEPNNNFRDFIDQETGNIKLPNGANRYKESLKLDYKKAFEKYKILHSNADNYTVSMSGDFQEDKILPLLQKYLGNLPNNELASCQDVDKIKVNIPKSNKVHHTFSEPIDNSYLSIQFRVPYERINYTTEIKLELLKAALDIKIRTLRYNKFLGVYSAKAVKKINPEININSIEIYLKCSKADFKEVVNSCEAFFEELKTGLIDDNTLQTIKKAVYLPKWNDSTKNYNNSVMKNLYGHYRFNLPIANYTEARTYFENFSAKDLKKAAQEYFKKDYKWVLTGGSENL